LIPLTGKPLRLHHIGFVVPSIEAAVQGFICTLGANWNGRIFFDPNQNVRVTFICTRPNDAQIELVEPASQDSPVRKFLSERGQGLHHLCYEAGDLELALTELKSKGALIAKKPKPAIAFGGRRIAWVLTREKLLVEVLESPVMLGELGIE
jgi:methylmalonyl-CoA/ethylmalonyl-CoA epimerase